jgi:hypothetical protein
MRAEEELELRSRLVAKRLKDARSLRAGVLEDILVAPWTSHTKAHRVAGDLSSLDKLEHLLLHHFQICSDESLAASKRRASWKMLSTMLKMIDDNAAEKCQQKSTTDSVRSPGVPRKPVNELLRPGRQLTSGMPQLDPPAKLSTNPTSTHLPSDTPLADSVPTRSANAPSISASSGPISTAPLLDQQQKSPPSHMDSANGNDRALEHSLTPVFSSTLDLSLERAMVIGEGAVMSRMYLSVLSSPNAASRVNCRLCRITVADDSAVIRDHCSSERHQTRLAAENYRSQKEREIRRAAAYQKSLIQPSHLPVRNPRRQQPVSPFTPKPPIPNAAAFFQKQHGSNGSLQNHPPVMPQAPKPPSPSPAAFFRKKNASTGNLQNRAAGIHQAPSLGVQPRGYPIAILRTHSSGTNPPVPRNDRTPANNASVLPTSQKHVPGTETRTANFARASSPNSTAMLPVHGNKDLQSVSPNSTAIAAVPAPNPKPLQPAIDVSTSLATATVNSSFAIGHTNGKRTVLEHSKEKPASTANSTTLMNAATDSLNSQPANDVSTSTAAATRAVNPSFGVDHTNGKRTVLEHPTEKPANTANSTTLSVTPRNLNSQPATDVSTSTVSAAGAVDSSLVISHASWKRTILEHPTEKRANTTTSTAFINPKTGSANSQPATSTARARTVTGRTNGQRSETSPEHPKEKPSSVLTSNPSRDAVPVPRLVTLQVAADRKPTFAGTVHIRPAVRVSFHAAIADETVLADCAARLQEWDPFWVHKANVATGITSLAHHIYPKTDLIKSAASGQLDIKSFNFQNRLNWGPNLRKGAMADKDIGLVLRMLPLHRGDQATKRADGHLWPKGTHLCINSRPVSLVQRKQQAHNLAEWCYVSKELNVAACISKPTDHNSFQICCFDNQSYYYMFSFCEHRTVETLMQQLTASTSPEKMRVVSIQEGSARAKLLAARQVALCVESGGEEQAAHDEVGKFVFSLQCPISKTIMETPVRGKNCKHWQVR